MKLKFDFGAIADSVHYLIQENKESQPMFRLKYRMYAIGALIKANIFQPEGILDVPSNIINTIKKL